MKTFTEPLKELKEFETLSAGANAVQERRPMIMPIIMEV